MTYTPRFPYAWSSPLVVAATNSFTAQFMVDDLRRRFFDEMQFLPYVEWHPLANEGQKAFFSPNHYSAAAALADELLAQDQPELTGIAHNSVVPVNQFLANNGFADVQLDPIGPNDFAVATVLRMLRHFKVAGESGYLLSEDMPHEAFRLSAGTFEVLSFGVERKPLVKLVFPQGDTLYIAVDTWTSLEGPALSMWVMETMNQVSSQGFEAAGVVLPNVSFNLDIDVSWLLGAQAWNQYKEIWTVAQAIKKVRFNMGADGFLFEAAFAMAMEKCVSMPKLPGINDVVVKDDFVAWMTTGSNSFPTWVVKVPVSAFSVEEIEIPSELPTHE